jgi:hypothetical protein
MSSFTTIGQQHPDAPCYAPDKGNPGSGVIVGTQHMSGYWDAYLVKLDSPCGVIDDEDTRTVPAGTVIAIFFHHVKGEHQIGERISFDHYVARP